MEDGMLWAALPAAAWGAALSWYDVRQRRLPNWLTVGGATVALLWRFSYGGLILFLDGFVAAAIAGFILLIPFLMRGAGGGDVKMLFAAGAMVGMADNRVTLMIIIVSMAGLLFGLAMLAANRLDGSRLKHFVRCAFDWRYDRKVGASVLPPRDSERVRVPFGIPIAFGLVVSMLLP